MLLLYAYIMHVYICIQLCGLNEYIITIIIKLAGIVYNCVVSVVTCTVSLMHTDGLSAGIRNSRPLSGAWLISAATPSSLCSLTKCINTYNME